MQEIFNTTNVEETEKIGVYLAEKLGEIRCDENWFICLTGDLGAGKTAFVRGFASVVSPGSRVKSPTYTVVNEYRKGRVPLFHFDLYRLEDGDNDLEAIGFDEYVEGGHCIIEWSEYLSEKPEDTVYADIRKTGDASRTVTITY
jgi:tRNA threonylcarbamoyladenosine biosynthesis protein TsaE